MTFECNGTEYETIEDFKTYVKENVDIFERDLASYLSCFSDEIISEFIYGRRYFTDINEVIDGMTENDMLTYFDDLYDLED